jgi:hypothetical protein
LLLLPVCQTLRVTLCEDFMTSISQACLTPPDYAFLVSLGHTLLIAMSDPILESSLDLPLAVSFVELRLMIISLTGLR